MTFPEPPWTQAPSEVIAWGTSIRGRSSSTAPAHRPLRVKGFETKLPAAEEPRLRRHFSHAGLSSPKEGSVHVPRRVPHLSHHAPAEVLRGRMDGTRVEVRLRKRNRLEVRMTFIPQIAFRKAWRIATRLGLRPTDGIWI